MLWKRIDIEGEFEMLWLDIRERKLLSYDILDSVPRLLFEKTKKKLINKTTEKVVKTIKVAIDKINAGSLKTIDKLVRKMSL